MIIPSSMQSSWHEITKEEYNYLLPVKQYKVNLVNRGTSYYWVGSDITYTYIKRVVLKYL
jgi:hypothetical protein